MKLDLNPEVLHEKIAQVSSEIDQEMLRQQVLELQGVESAMRELDARIKVISNRCQNELAPRHKAVRDPKTKTY